MKKNLFIIFCFFLSLLSYPLAAIDIVCNGKGKSVIVIEKNSPEQYREAAEILQNYIHKISGARLPVLYPENVPEKTVKICIGENFFTKRANYTLPPAENTSAYHIFVKDDLIVLNGPTFRQKENDPAKKIFQLHKQDLYRILTPFPKQKNEPFYQDFGPMHAISAFLEHLGARFYAPGREGTFLPRKKTITIQNMDIFRKAAFAVRKYTFSPDLPLDHSLSRHLQMLKSGTAHPRTGVFSLEEILQKYGKKYPSILAHNEDGTICKAVSNNGYPRYTDETFRKICLAELSLYLRKNPSINDILILPPPAVKDFIHAPDEAKYKKKVHPVTYERDIPASFYAFLAKGTEQLFPGKRFLYYSSGNLLPGKKVLASLPDTLAGVPEALGLPSYAFPALRKFHLDSAEKFVKATGKGKRLTREYWNEYDSTNLLRRGFYFAKTLQEIRIRQQKFLDGFLIDLPFDGVSKSLAEPEQMYFLLYINSKLLWEPTLDLDALMKEYCTHLFGPAQEEMRKFYIAAENALCALPMRGLTPLYSKEFYQQAEELKKHLLQAEKKTLRGSIYGKRIRKIAESLSWIYKKDLFKKWEKKKNFLTGEIVPRETTLDGNLSKYKKWYPLSSGKNSLLPRTEAAFTFCETRFKVFAAFRCYEPAMEKLSGKCKKQDDLQIRKEDHITLRIRTSETGEYVFTVNSAGTILDECSNPDVLKSTGNARNWNHWQNDAVVRKYPDRWEVELSIVRCGRAPSPGSFPWKIQLERTRFTAGKKQEYFLTEDPEKFTDLYFPLLDSKGRKFNARYYNVNKPIAGIPDGKKYVIKRRKDVMPGFTPHDWEGKSWKDIPEGRLGNNLFYLGSSSSHEPDTRFKMQYDKEKLYIFYKIREKGVRAIFSEDQKPVCLDSCIELFLRPGGKKGKYYMNFEMNCVGAMLVAQVKIVPGKRGIFTLLPKEDMKKIKRHTTLKETHKEYKEEILWYAGLEIPWEIIKKYTGFSVPEKGSSWSGNIFKCADWSRYPHFLSWKETISFHLPERFGEFFLE